MIKYKFILLFALSFFSFSVLAQEICDNGIDDDGDGLVDLNDIEDCECTYLGGNTEVESLIPNASFETMDGCCPNSFSQLSCADTWIQASGATSDYMNDCNFMPTGVPQPIPDGDAVVGAIFLANWYECIGACLNEPFIAGEDYLLSMQISSAMVDGSLGYSSENNLGVIDVTIYGSPNCDDLPFAGTLCPMEDAGGEWEVIGTYSYDPLWEWQEIIFELSSTVDINSIVIGPPCGMPDAYEDNFGDYAYFMYDDLVLNEASLFDSSISGSYYDEENDVWIIDGEIYNEDTGEWDYVGAVCSDIIELIGNADTTGTFQWFYEGVALEGETDTLLTMPFDTFEQGEYQFVLYIDGTEECTTATYTTDIPDYPVAEYSVTDVCFPGDVTFTDESTFVGGDLIDWEWTINDELIAGAYQEIDHFFEEVGPHEVQLIVQSFNFCRDTLITDVVLEYSPEVNFSIENACVGEITEFVDETIIQGDNELSDWNWSFDNNADTSSEQNPEYTYDVYQEYNVSLSVESDNGCSSDTVITIQAFPTPQVSFTTEPVCIETPNASFVNESTITEGFINEWYWDFGDAGTSLAENPSHIYSESGEYDVSLVGVSNFGCEGSADGSQLVSEVIVDFNYGTVAGCSPFCTNFQEEINTNSGLIENVLWEFSNGEESTDFVLDMCFSNGSHTETIKHSVKLSATNTYGCQHSMELNDLIEVWPIPLASFDATPDRTEFLTPEISFTNTSIGAVDFNWNFGDGNVSDELNPIHTYEDALVFPVELTVTSDKGCIDKVIKAVDILPMYNIYIPNAFTPQGDGINEVFYPVINGGLIEIYSFEIRDQWNEVVFTTQNPDDFWNGSYLNNNEYFVQDGIYVWHIKVKFDRLPEAFEDQGTLLIVR